jgi:uncharacterized protein YbjQ (UPF0145 family)
MSFILPIMAQLLLPALLLLITYNIGSRRERKHFESIRRREEETLQFPVVTFRSEQPGWEVESCALVTGSVIISLDYFKRFVAALRSIVGGHMGGYESLLDRARREAMLRMKEDAISKGFDVVINVRFETSRLASAAQNGKGTAGVEMLVFGTALQLAKESDGGL